MLVFLGPLELESVGFLIFNFFFELLGFELRAYTLSHSTSPFFVLGFIKIGSRELLTQAGFKP
jgi:hypothetical protein